MTRTHIVTASVVTECPQEALHAAELLQRVSMGLALEGITVRMDFTSYEQENDDETEEEGQGPDSSDHREAPEP